MKCVYCYYILFLYVVVSFNTCVWAYSEIQSPKNTTVNECNKKNVNNSDAQRGVKNVRQLSTTNCKKVVSNTTKEHGVSNSNISEVNRNVNVSGNGVVGKNMGVENEEFTEDAYNEKKKETEGIFNVDNFEELSKNLLNKQKNNSFANIAELNKAMLLSDKSNVNNNDDMDNKDDNNVNMLEDERKRKALLIRILKNIKDILHKQKVNFNDFVTYLSENYTIYEKVTLPKQINMINANKNKLHLQKTGNNETNSSFLNLTEPNSLKRKMVSSGNKLKTETGGKGGLDISLMMPGESEEPTDNRGDDSNDENRDEGNHDRSGEIDIIIGGDRENDQTGNNNENTNNEENVTSADWEKMNSILSELIDSESITENQKKYLKIIKKILDLEGELLNKEMLQHELSKNIIDMLLNKSNELRSIAVRLINENKEAGGSQRVDLAQNIVSNLLNFSIELKNTGNIVYNNIQGQGDLLQAIENKLSDAQSSLRDISVHTIYKNRDKTDIGDGDNNDGGDNDGGDSDNNNNNDNNSDNVIDKEIFMQHHNFNVKNNTQVPTNYKKNSSTLNEYNITKYKSNFKISKSMKDRFFDTFAKEEMALKRLFKLLYDII
ncbi:rhoptry-associated leucine zipper-like protein 1, putative [Hepatocystis sp. ex Piliocolobus tephrosceles]|nr:rhoptry-associated leucine zipper-like protein 1, putative [Hepatocystis sp. ex Piliocolobus tephrosceles]